MKTAIILLLSLTAFGCAKSPLAPQPIEDAAITMSEHLDKVAFSRTFCDGESVKHYYESTLSYVIKCKDGRSFTLRK